MRRRIIRLTTLLTLIVPLFSFNQSTIKVFRGTPPIPQSLLGESAENNSYNSLNGSSAVLIDNDNVPNAYLAPDQSGIFNIRDSETGQILYFLEVSDVPFIQGARICTGYQGWFATPGDGFLNNFNHWFTGPQLTQDLWPLVEQSDYPDRYETDIVLNDGTNAYLYSAAYQSTVNTHVEWMKEYGIQCVFVGRFMQPLIDRNQAYVDFRNKVVDNFANATNNSTITQGDPKFAIFYNLTTSKTTVPTTRDYLTELWEDWKWVVDNTNWINNAKYLKKDGEPVLRIYGIGFRKRPSGIESLEAKALIDSFSIATD